MNIHFLSILLHHPPWIKSGVISSPMVKQLPDYKCWAYYDGSCEWPIEHIHHQHWPWLTLIHEHGTEHECCYPDKHNYQTMNMSGYSIKVLKDLPKSSEFNQHIIFIFVIGCHWIIKVFNSIFKNANINVDLGSNLVMMGKDLDLWNTSRTT